MATKKPIANYTGRQKEIGSGDFVDPATLGTGSGGASKFLREDNSWQTVAGGPGSNITVGTATIDFGAFPGVSDASVAVTGQTGIVAGSIVQAWIRPVATADHSADEHLIETIKVVAGNIVAGTGFTIYASNTSQLNEPLEEAGYNRNHISTGTAAANTGFGSAINPSVGGNGTRIYGQWTVAWSWV